MKHYKAPYAIVLTTILLAMGLFIFPQKTFALNYGYLISDFEFFDSGSMTVNSIQNFLSSKPGKLATQSFTTEDGETMTSANIIYRYAKQYQINPKVLMVTLQKEQSLITNPSPSQNAYDCAMGYEWGNGCQWMYANKPSLKGFANQVQSGAWQFRQYTTYPSQYAYQPGNTYSVDGQSIAIQNQATANLYNYTPHTHGNEMFAYWWSQWFALIYPDGVLLRAKKEPGVWLISNGQRRGFSSGLAFVSRGYSQANVLQVNKTEIEKFPLGPSIDFNNYSLVRDENGSLYMIDGLTKRMFSSQEVFENLGFHIEEVQQTTTEKLASYSDGEPLASAASYPTGILLQNSSTGAIAYVKNGIMHAIHSKDILKSQFPKATWIRVSNTEFNSFPWGEPLKLKDGTLIKTKGKPHVYVISNGQKRHIPTSATFKALGFSRSRILIVSDKVLSLHATGPAIGITN